MQITLTSRKNHKPSLYINAGKGFLLTVLMIKGSLLGGAIYLGFELGKTVETPEKIAYKREITHLNSQVSYAQRELEKLEFKMENSITSIIREVGSIKGNLITISAKQDAEAMHSGFDSDEFNASKEKLIKNAIEFEDKHNLMDFWEEEERDLQELINHLQVRQSILSSKSRSDRESETYTFIERPVKDSKAWLSSRYGYRSDPFTGKRRWHDGIDLAGFEGSDIIAASAGIVTYVGDRFGYGNLVEISHNDTVVTRYGHNKEILVKKGDQVNAGDPIATMGNSGRSTGPHVHFEVLVNGRSKNPLDYLGNPLKKPD